MVKDYEDSNGKDPEQATAGPVLARREFVKKALVAGGVLGAAMTLGGGLGVARALADTSAGGVAGEEWEDPRLTVNDGWNNWDNILNPKKLPVWYENFSQIQAAKPKQHWVMVVDLRKCVGCQSCTVACKSENNVPLGVYRTFVDVSESGKTYSDAKGQIVANSGTYTNALKMSNIPKICNHCNNPPCVPVCPVKATYKRLDGIVLIDPRICIGCGACVKACPYAARYINPVTRLAEKCTYCVERVDGNLIPACVTSCVGRARIFGNLNDPESDVARLIASNTAQIRKPEMGTQPQVFYIGSSASLSIDANPAEQKLWYTYTMNEDSSVYRKLIGG